MNNKDVKGSGGCLILGTVGISLQVLRKITNNLQKACLWAEIWTQDFPYMKQES
jgi:hypothetical protein